jgi:hypothetical protein
MLLHPDDRDFGVQDFMRDDPGSSLWPLWYRKYGFVDPDRVAKKQAVQIADTLDCPQRFRWSDPQNNWKSGAPPDFQLGLGRKAGRDPPLIWSGPWNKT